MNEITAYGIRNMHRVLKTAPNDNMPIDIVTAICINTKIMLRIISAFKLIYAFKLSDLRSGVVGRITAFQSGDPDSIPGGFRDHFYPGNGCVLYLCYVLCVCSSGPANLLT